MFAAIDHAAAAAPASQGVIANPRHRKISAIGHGGVTLRAAPTKHHRFLLSLHLNQIDALNAAMATLDTQVEANLGPYTPQSN